MNRTSDRLDRQYREREAAYYAGVLDKVNAQLTEENDCSMFHLTLDTYPEPTTLYARPDQVRHILTYLGSGVDS